MIGELKNKLTIPSVTSVPDEGGGSAVLWSGGYTVSAKVSNAGFFRDPRTGYGVRKIMAVIRYVPSLREGDRIIFDNSRYKITGMKTNENSSQMSLSCEEVPS